MKNDRIWRFGSCLALAVLIWTCLSAVYPGAVRAEDAAPSWAAIDAHVENMEGEWYTGEAMLLKGTAEPGAVLACKVYGPGYTVEKSATADAEGVFSIELTAEECSIGSGGTIFAFISYAEQTVPGLSALSWSSENIEWDCYPPLVYFETQREEDGKLLFSGVTDGTEVLITGNGGQVKCPVDYNGGFASKGLVTHPGDGFVLTIRDDAGNVSERTYVPADTEIGGISGMDGAICRTSDVLEIEGWYACFSDDREVSLVLARVEWDDGENREKLVPVDTIELADREAMPEGSRELTEHIGLWKGDAEVRTGWTFRTRVELNALKLDPYGQYRVLLRWYDREEKKWYEFCSNDVPFTVLQDREEGNAWITAMVEERNGRSLAVEKALLSGTAEPGSRLICTFNSPRRQLEIPVTAGEDGNFALEFSAEALEIPAEGTPVFIVIRYGDETGDPDQDRAWLSGEIFWDWQGPALEVKTDRMNDGNTRFVGTTDGTSVAVFRNDEPIGVELNAEGAFESAGFIADPGDALTVRARDAAGNLSEKRFKVKEHIDTEIGYVWQTSGEYLTADDTLAVSGWYACLEAQKDIELSMYRVEWDEQEGRERLHHAGQLPFGSSLSMADDPSKLEVHLKLWPREANVSFGYEFRTQLELSDLALETSGEYVLILRWYNSDKAVYYEISRSDPFHVEI